MTPSKPRPAGVIHFVMAAVFFAAGIGVFFFNRGPSKYVGILFAVLFGARRIAVGLAERRAAMSQSMNPSSPDASVNDRK